MRARVRIPATTANCGPGFDTLGIACALYNEVLLEMAGPLDEVQIRVSGDGADTAVSELFGALAQYPALVERLQLAERRSDQRWTLHLTRGAVLQLPSEDQGEAIARAAVLVAAGFVEKGEIDLRVAGRDFLGQRKRLPGKPPRAADAQTPSGRS